MTVNVVILLAFLTLIFPLVTKPKASNFSQLTKLSKLNTKTASAYLPLSNFQIKTY